MLHTCPYSHRFLHPTCYIHIHTATDSHTLHVLCTSTQTQILIPYNMLLTVYIATDSYTLYATYTSTQPLIFTPYNMLHTVHIATDSYTLQHVIYTSKQPLILTPHNPLHNTQQPLILKGFSTLLHNVHEESETPGI